MEMRSITIYQVSNYLIIYWQWHRRYPRWSTPALLQNVNGSIADTLIRDKTHVDRGMALSQL